MLKYDEAVLLNAITYDSDVYLIEKDKAELLQARLQPAVVDPAPDLDPGGTDPSGKDQAPRSHRVRLVVEGVPASRIADVNHGIFMPLSGSVDNLSSALEIDVSRVEGIDSATVKDKNQGNDPSDRTD